MADTPTQTAHPWRASVRTALSVALALLTALAVAGPSIVDFVSEQFPGSPAVGIVASVIGFIVGLSLLVNRLILLGPVAELIQKIGLGPVPNGGAN